MHWENKSNKSASAANAKGIDGFSSQLCGIHAISHQPLGPLTCFAEDD